TTLFRSAPTTLPPAPKSPRQSPAPPASAQTYTDTAPAPGVSPNRAAAAIAPSPHGPPRASSGSIVSTAVHPAPGYAAARRHLPPSRLRPASAQSDRPAPGGSVETPPTPPPRSQAASPAHGERVWKVESEHCDSRSLRIPTSAAE